MLKKLVYASVLAIVFVPIPNDCPAQESTPKNPSGSILELMRYEPTGLSLVSPYARGKIPVVFVHGLWMTPSSWHKMIASLEDDPAIKDRYQFWTFGYSTGDPIPYSAYLMRKNLESVRKKFDPDKTDTALDRMVIVGHSMGGLLSKMMAGDTNDRLWKVISDRPFAELSGEKDDVNLFRDGLFFGARPEVRRVVYIATPHRGSHFDRGAIQHIGTRLVRIADPLQAAHERLVARNAPEFFHAHFRKAIPTSIDELEIGSPMLHGLENLTIAPVIKTHSIIAVIPGSPPGEGTDGLVRYVSSHVEGVVSEKVVSTGHLCQEHHEVIGEVKRILGEHAAN